MKSSVIKVLKYHEFRIVILLEHLHMLWMLPRGDADYSTRWKIIKTLFSKAINQDGTIIKKSEHGEYILWQRRFWEHTIRNDIDFENHFNYIHYNPIKHKLVNDLQKWPYSSFHHYVKIGKISKNWGLSDEPHENSCNFGE